MDSLAWLLPGDVRGDIRWVVEQECGVGAMGNRILNFKARVNPDDLQTLLRPRDAKLVQDPVHSGITSVTTSHTPTSSGGTTAAPWIHSTSPLSGSRTAVYAICCVPAAVWGLSSSQKFFGICWPASRMARLPRSFARLSNELLLQL